MGEVGAAKGLHIILATTLFIFSIIEHQVAYGCISLGRSTARSLSASNDIYIEIDHELVPRKIANINEMSPLPVPPGRDSARIITKLYERQIQEVFLEIEETKENNIPKKNIDYHFNGTWKSESEIRKSKLKSVLGTDGKVYYDHDFGLMSAVLACYNHHWVLKTGPEDWWTVVIRRIAQAIDKHGEVPQVRNHFVEHEGQKKLEVNVGPTLSNVNYNWLFSQFSSQIRENIKIPGYVDIIENDFSSSTDEQTMISHIMLMSSVKKYFAYGFMFLCGIPGVEMKGTEEDWVKLIDKLNRMETLLSPINEHLHLTAWFTHAKEVFKNLLNTYKGYPNIKWWRSILFRNVERWGSGHRSHYTGWLPEFVVTEDSHGKYSHFPSDLVTVPIHIQDRNSLPPVEDDGILVAGIIGFTVEEGGRAPVVEPKHAWGLLLPEDSPVVDRL